MQIAIIRMVYSPAGQNQTSKSQAKRDTLVLRGMKEKSQNVSLVILRKSRVEVLCQSSQVVNEELNPLVAEW